MSESLLDIRDRIRPRISLAPLSSVEPTESEEAARLDEPALDPPLPEPTSSPAFVVESKETGKIIVTMPAETAREQAGITAEDFLLRLSGRLVEAEKANLNGAFWSSGDLEFGLPSVALGPLNWLHQERKIVGVLTAAHLVRPTEIAATATPTSGSQTVRVGNPHIQADAVLWKWLYPAEAREVSAAADQRQLWYSMECVSRKVECVGEGGCGKVVDYRERSSANACSHMREKSAHRRLVEPIFQGAAIIVPPVKPGWADADLTVERQAAALVEKQEIEVPGLSTQQAEQMVALVMGYANT